MIRQMRVTSVIGILLLITACSLNKNDGGSNTIKENGITYEHVKQGIYQGSDGRKYVRTQSLRNPPEEYGPLFFRPIPNIDVPTFTKLCSQGWYAKDKDSVYIWHTMTDGTHVWVVEEADAQSFECIRYRWAKDKSYVFNNGTVLKGLNPDSLALLVIPKSEYGKGYFDIVKDNDQVYYDREELHSVDAKSFEYHLTSDSIHYRDKNWLYTDRYFNGQNSKHRISR